MYVEDKISHRGPFPIHVTEHLSLGELKQQIEREFEIPINVQRWILGKELATKDNSTLKDYDITTDGLPVFLYLVAPEKQAAEGQQICDTKTPIQHINLPSTAVNVKEIYADSKHNSKSTSRSQPFQDNSKSIVKELKLPNTLIVDDSQQIVAPKVVSVIPKVVESIAKEQQKLGARPRQNSVEIKPLAIDVTKKGFKHIEADYMTRNKDAEEITKNVVNSTLYLGNYDDSNAQKNKIDVTKIMGAVDFNKKVALTNLMQKCNNKNMDKIATDVQTIAIDISVNATHSNEKTENKLNRDKGLDAKTLKREVDEWECHLCTLLNPVRSNICAVCATVRLKINNGDQRPMSKNRVLQPVVKTNDKNCEDQTYLLLVNLDNADLVENVEQFECAICFLHIPPGKGVTLRECLHQFCKICLAQTIEYTDEAEVKCPYRDDQYSCNIALQDREIKTLLTPDAYEKFLAKSVAQAENKIGKSFHCKSPDCKGWCIIEDNVNHFLCPVCCKINCLTCQAIHTNMNCMQYQERMNSESEIDENAKRTKEMLKEMVAKGEAIACPTCQVILMKKWGCDWLRCSMCKTEICWVTRGPRWGPAGKGDTSGGCQCGVNGTKCHPHCNYCH